MGKLKYFKGLRRKLIQLSAAVLYNMNVKGFANIKNSEIFRGDYKGICVPGLNCYSCPGAIGACPLGSLQNSLASSSFKGWRAAYYVVGVLLLFSLFLGRVICGFLCPFGLIQELLYKIPGFKVKKSRVTRVLSYLKYVILAVFVIGIPLYLAYLSGDMYNGYPAFCKYICPAGTLEGGIPLALFGSYKIYIGTLFYIKLAILALMIIGSVFIFRMFCRFICPLGAIYSLFAKIVLLGVHVDDDKCINCGKCVRACKMDIKKIGDHECIQCGECIDRCPVKAISRSFFSQRKKKEIIINPDKLNNNEKGEQL